MNDVISRFYEAFHKQPSQKERIARSIMSQQLYPNFWNALVQFLGEDEMAEHFETYVDLEKLTQKCYPLTPVLEFRFLNIFAQDSIVYLELDPSDREYLVQFLPRECWSSSRLANYGIDDADHWMIDHGLTPDEVMDRMDFYFEDFHDYDSHVCNRDCHTTYDDLTRETACWENKCDIDWKEFGNWRLGLEERYQQKLLKDRIKMDLLLLRQWYYNTDPADFDALLRVCARPIRQVLILVQQLAKLSVRPLKLVYQFLQ